MNIEKNFQNLYKLAEKYEEIMKKFTDKKQPIKSSLDADMICKNMISMYNDALTTSYNLYSILNYLRKTGNKTIIDKIEDVTTKLKNSQGSFIALFADFILRITTTPVKLVGVSKLIALEKIKALGNVKSTESIIDRMKKAFNQDFNAVKLVANALVSEPLNIGGTLQSDVSKFMDKIISYCLTLSSYLENIVETMQTLKEVEDLSLQDIETFLSEYLEFFENSVKNTKPVPHDVCTNFDEKLKKKEI